MAVRSLAKWTATPGRGSSAANTRQGETALGHLKKAQTLYQEMDMDYWLDRTEKIMKTLNGKLKGRRANATV
jgi:hypothetical protein